MTTNKTFKQIAKEIESGKTINAREVQTHGYYKVRYHYSIEIDGERYEVSTVSWNKMQKAFNAKRTFGEEVSFSKGTVRTIGYEISAK